MFDPTGEPTREIRLSQWEINALLLAWEYLPVTSTDGHLRWLVCQGKLKTHQERWKKELETPDPPANEIEQMSVVTKPTRKKGKGNASTEQQK